METLVRHLVPRSIELTVKMIRWHLPIKTPSPPSKIWPTRLCHNPTHEDVFVGYSTVWQTIFPPTCFKQPWIFCTYSGTCRRVVRSWSGQAENNSTRSNSFGALPAKGQMRTCFPFDSCSTVWYNYTKKMNALESDLQSADGQTGTWRQIPVFNTYPVVSCQSVLIHHLRSEQTAQPEQLKGISTTMRFIPTRCGTLS